MLFLVKRLMDDGRIVRTGRLLRGRRGAGGRRDDRHTIVSEGRDSQAGHGGKRGEKIQAVSGSHCYCMCCRSRRVSCSKASLFQEPHRIFDTGTLPNIQINYQENRKKVPISAKIIIKNRPAVKRAIGWPVLKPRSFTRRPTRRWKAHAPLRRAFLHPRPFWAHRHRAFVGVARRTSKRPVPPSSRRIARRQC